MSPQRIQRKRTKGWRMPEGALYVGRPTRWGNPFLVGAPSEVSLFGWSISCRGDALAAVMCFTVLSAHQYAEDSLGMEFYEPLRGRDLACWCPLTYPDGRPYPCHADVLLAVANR